MSFIRGVLLAGKLRNQDELSGMSPDDQRNTLIVGMAALTNQPVGDFQAMDDDTLAGVGAVLVFLRETGIRDDGALRTLSVDDQRNVLIVEIAAQTGLSTPALQGMTNIELVSLGLGRDGSFIRGVLLAAKYRRHHDLNAMSHSDQRNTLIVEMAARTNQSVAYFQSLNDGALAGAGAVYVFLRDCGIRSEEQLRTISDDDQRNVMIVVLAAQTGLSVPELQSRTSLELVRIGLSVVAGYGTISVDVCSVRKVCQLTGEWDRQFNRRAFNSTECRSGVFGTDLGYSFEHDGRLWFLFGDTWPRFPEAHDDNDSVAWSTSVEPEPGVHLDFISENGRYKSPRLWDSAGQALPTAGFQVPVAGFSAGGQMYIFYITEFSPDEGSGVRTVLAEARNNDPTDLRVLYELSNRRFGGRFLNVACAIAERGLAGLPFAGPTLLAWGSGLYRHSNVSLACVPLGSVRDRSAWRFFSNPGPCWSQDEHSSMDLFEHRQVGELSVEWIAPLELWLMLYNSGCPRGINARVATQPWGPWSDPIVIFHPDWPGLGYGHFMHRGSGSDSLSDPGREQEWGGEYGPYLINRYTRNLTSFPDQRRKAQVYFALSTWNPYNVVLMTATIVREGLNVHLIQPRVSEVATGHPRFRFRAARSVEGHGSQTRPSD